MIAALFAPALLVAIWLDTDNSAAAALPGDGAPREIDDALALLMLLHSPLEIAGISTTFGNAPTSTTTEATRRLLAEHGRADVPVHEGAHSRHNLTSELPAVEAMAAALSSRIAPLDVVALGALTNVAALVRREPDLARQKIRKIVFVGGRRPQQLFTIGSHPETLPDLNFEKDSKAADALLRSGVPLVLCPFELSAQIRLGTADMESRRKQSVAGAWAADVAQPWIAHWRATFGADYFHPFDCLAVLYLTRPRAVKCQRGVAAIERGPSDPVSTVQESHTEGDGGAVHGVGVPSKLYLHVRVGGGAVGGSAVGEGEVEYCHGVGADAKRLILDGIAGDVGYVSVDELCAPAPAECII